jgi:hypothetical protein
VMTALDRGICRMMIVLPTGMEKEGERERERVRLARSG